MSKVTIRKKFKNRQASSRGGSRQVLSSLARNTLSLSHSDVQTDTRDYSMKPLTTKLPNVCPRNISNQVYWVQYKVSATLTTPATTALETNFAFHLNDNSTVSNLLGQFDQVGLFAVICNFEVVNSITQGTANLGRLLTAIDYDDVTTNSFDLVETRSSANIVALFPKVSHQRVIKPCLASALFRSNVTTGYSPAREWLDTTYLDAPWYGLRTWIAPTNVGGNVLVNYEFTYIVCCRNTL